ncbi:unnamed protein product [Spodoptera littoralis]|uniref:Kazal-like domain-containing protein n=1 Tax=Spodoptera littoralis TaxID=7109 RepID=A0A9P0HZH7_SPOLI|nr:unnamed protein product [Spodoptera littoralis]CAH1638362.1 unnamed protein product [Spodoptera littoralis]
MKKLHYMLICINIVHGKLSHDAKKEFCENLKCDENEDAPVCGMRYEENGIRLRLFDNECQLMKFGCKVDKNQNIY